MPSFDVVSKVEMQEVVNAVNLANKEIATRFDFRNTNSELLLDQDKGELRFNTSDDMHLRSMVEVLNSKLAKRGVSILAVKFGKVEQASGNRVRQSAKLQQGIDQDTAKKVVKIIKAMPEKIQASIMDEMVRVTGKKRDDLQAVISELRRAEGELSVPFQFVNMRD